MLETKHNVKCLVQNLYILHVCNVYVRFTHTVFKSVTIGVNK